MSRPPWADPEQYPSLVPGVRDHASGGPEDPSLVARGSVHKISPSSGKTRRIATTYDVFANGTLATIGKPAELLVVGSESAPMSP
jgi:hypothetical protein